MTTVAFSCPSSGCGAGAAAPVAAVGVPTHRVTGALACVAAGLAAAGVPEVPGVPGMPTSEVTTFFVTEAGSASALRARSAGATAAAGIALAEIDLAAETAGAG